MNIHPVRIAFCGAKNGANVPKFGVLGKPNGLGGPVSKPNGLGVPASNHGSESEGLLGSL